MAKFGPPRTHTNYISRSKSIAKSCLKMFFLLNLSHCLKSYGNFCQILAPFTMPACQILCCHVIQDVNLENLLCFLNSTFNIRKSHKISSEKALDFRSYQHKTSQGWKTPPPPSAFRAGKRSGEVQCARFAEHCEMLLSF